MAKTVAFHLQKGGVGKTTISGTLACESALTAYWSRLLLSTVILRATFLPGF